jgi:hypothetical protein
MNPTGGVPSPLLNRANIVTKLVPSYQSFTVTSGKNVADPKGPNLYADNADAQNKSYIEAPVRAISSVANTRTWNLLIDIIAQSGQMIPNATTLDQFSVQGERRYWLHLAIDRYTGKVVAQQLEPVYE